MRKHPKMPPVEGSGLIRTLNKMGYMATSLDPYSKAIVGFAPKAPGPFLDIGAAYGIASLAALKRGCDVIANDLDPNHLEILWRKTPPKFRSRLKLLPGKFPDRLVIPPQGVGAILISRLFHFFDGPTIVRSVKTLFNWLAPGGKVAVIADTLYLKPYVKLLPIYERRRKAGKSWPGFFENGQKYNKKRSEFLPKHFHCLDPKVLRREFTEAGFILEKVSIFPRPDYFPDVRLDGRENVGLIAQKPSTKRYRLPSGHLR